MSAEEQKPQGPTALHGRILVEAIADIEQFAVDVLSNGYVPVLDAVELARFLRALVSGATVYRADIEQYHRRSARMKTAGTTTTVIAAGWNIAPPSGQDQ